MVVLSLPNRAPGTNIGTDVSVICKTERTVWKDLLTDGCQTEMIIGVCSVSRSLPVMRICVGSKKNETKSHARMNSRCTCPHSPLLVALGVHESIHFCPSHTL